MDFVASWFKKSADFIQGTLIECCFVATNSLCQGIAVPPLWNYLYKRGITINFAYQTFKWNSEARGKAAVHCVIVGFSLFKRGEKLLFIENECSVVENINPYLIAYKDIIIDARAQALCDVPPISVGSFAVDGGNLIMSDEEAQNLINQDETLSNFIRPYYSPEDFIQGKPRYCFWLKDIPLSILRRSAILRDRLKAVQSFRSTSKKVPTQKKAATPWLFGEDRQPDSDYILIPRTSSESRAYIPMGFMTSDVIAGDTIILPNATLYHFGILTSSMHMAWMKTVCGRMKSDYRYSGNMAYNNYPWPDATTAQQEKITELAQAVLDARALYPDSSLADLYDPLTMPPELVAAHRKLDAAVEKAYGRKFTDDAERVAFLFEKYNELISKG